MQIPVGSPDTCCKTLVTSQSHVPRYRWLDCEETNTCQTQAHLQTTIVKGASSPPDVG